MATIVAAMYGLYLIMVGIKGNANQALAELGTESQYLYWVVVFLIITALWESPVGGEVAKPLAGLIVIGFLLSGNNYQTIGANFTALMTALKNGQPTTGVA